MMNQRIGSFIAALRKEQGLTQEQLAEKLGSATAVFPAGKRAKPFRIFL